MNVKKTLEERIRGWLPKDASFPSTAQVNQKTSRHKLLIVYATIFAAVSATVFITYGILEVLSLGSYPSYVPATAAGVAASIAIVLTIRRNQNPNISKAGKAIKQLQGLEKRIRGWFPKEPNLSGNQTKVAENSKVPTANINFRARGIITLIIGFAIFIVGVALHFSLNAEPTFLSVVLGFSVPFFFIGCLLLRAHIRVKKGKSPISDNFFFHDPVGAEKS